MSEEKLWWTVIFPYKWVLLPHRLLISMLDCCLVVNKKQQIVI